MTSASRQRRLVAILAGVTLFAAGLSLGRTVAQPPSPGENDGRLQALPAPDSGVVGASAPSGDTHTRAGAVDAAAAMVSAFDGMDVLDSASRRALLDQHAARASRAELGNALSTVADLFLTNLDLDGEAASDPGFVWRTVPAGWQVLDYSDAGAIVAVWSTGVLIADGLPLVQPGWRTTDVELVWEQGDWRLVSFLSRPGPQPPPVGGGAGASSQARLINAFEPFRQIAPTVESQP